MSGEPPGVDGIGSYPFAGAPQGCRKLLQDGGSEDRWLNPVHLGKDYAMMTALVECTE